VDRPERRKPGDASATLDAFVYEVRGTELALMNSMNVPP
jgi:hypothetical protein